MAWKMATGFVLSGELRDPDAITAFAVARDVRQGMMRLISRGPPISFGEITELDESDIEDGLMALLPRGETTMTAEMVAELECVFGEGGEIGAGSGASGAGRRRLCPQACRGAIRSGRISVPLRSN